jgi:hypothetical protein
MPITLNGTTGLAGNVTGNVAGNVTGAVTGNADTATTATKLSTATGLAPSYACRAWVRFDGTRDTTGATSTANTNRFIHASGNVATVLRQAVGIYVITFSIPMEDSGYCAVISQSDPTGLGAANVNQPLAATCSVSTGRVSPIGNLDAATVTFAVFR